MRLTLLLLCLLVSACSSTLERQRAARQANPAPCPNVFVLEDASRFIAFGGEERSLETVAFSGEFLDVSTSCRYYSDVPITAEVDLEFAIGRGPAATRDSTTVRYFVAVTRTNRDVIAKEVFEVPVTFKNGQRVASFSHTIDEIVIPRAGEDTSGLNFEIAVGFVLDRGQLLFNRSGESLKFPEA